MMNAGAEQMLMKKQERGRTKRTKTTKNNDVSGADPERLIELGGDEERFENC
jgi:hypothetical protein